MRLIEKYKEEVERFCKVCQSLARDKFATGTGGNLAWRLEDDVILITPTQVNKGDITPEDVVFIRPDGEKVEGRLRPTGEVPMYLKFFSERPDIKSVIHCHPPHVCALSIARGDNRLMRPIFPETVIEVGPVPLVPYGEPLTEELAENFSKFLPKYNSFVMENHGLVTMSRGDINWTHMNVELLEMSARSIILALSIGGIKEIPAGEISGLEGIMGKRSLPMFGAPGVNKSLAELYRVD